jgi:hypothetical protein
MKSVHRRGVHRVSLLITFKPFGGGGGSVRREQEDLKWGFRRNGIRERMAESGLIWDRAFTSDDKKACIQQYR